MSLAEKDWYLTGTMLMNRIPQHICIAKESARYKGMQRGDADEKSNQPQEGDIPTIGR